MRSLHRTAMCALAAALQFISATASAHAVGTSYINVAPSKDAISTRVDLSLRDLNFAVGLDIDGDGRITWAEVQASSGALQSYVTQHLNIARGGQVCAMTGSDISIDRHADEVYAAMTFEGRCGASGLLAVQSTLMFDLDDSHRSLLTVAEGGAATITVLTDAARSWNGSSRSNALANFARFVGQGIWHIWIGFDHLAFLLLLLLPLIREPNSNSSRHYLKQIFKVVTAFTLAHSITLACAALGYVNLPTRWTEAAIAASIVIAAIANLLQRSARFGIAMAFGFGLIHGLGFASALADITAGTTQRVLPLLGFNLGVELGQLAVVAVVFPILFRPAPFQLRQRTIFIGSLAMGGLGVAWLVQRTLLS